MNICAQNERKGPAEQTRSTPTVRYSDGVFKKYPSQSAGYSPVAICFLFSSVDGSVWGEQFEKKTTCGVSLNEILADDQLISNAEARHFAHQYTRK